MGAASGEAASRAPSGVPSRLHYYRARYYHPRLARFISEDPIGLAGGDLNLYAYVGNDPVNIVDLDGLSASGDFVRGAASYFEGIYGTFRYAARFSGLLGKCEQRRAELEGVVLAEALALAGPPYLERQEVRNVVADVAIGYVSTHKARFAGRATTVTIVNALGLAGGPCTTALATALTAAAVHGNVRLAIERGGRKLEDVVRGAVGGNDPLRGRKDGCE